MIGVFMAETARDIMNRLKAEYADYDEALELIENSYDDILSYPPDRALRLAKDAERTLSLYY